jgi:GTP cyclohydrolase IA
MAHDATRRSRSEAIDLDRAGCEGALALAGASAPMWAGGKAIPMPGRRHAGRVADLARATAAVRELLLALGEDPTRDGLRDTPKRVAKSLIEQTAGLRQRPEQHLARVFEADYDGAVQVCDIPFTSLCEHHLLTFRGVAHIAYIPSARQVVGLSKLARVVEGFARRPQVQERLTTQIADAIVEALAPRGVVVRLQAEHLCMQVRGVRAHGGSTVTVVRRGELQQRPEAWPELHGLISGAR